MFMFLLTFFSHVGTYSIILSQNKFYLLLQLISSRPALYSILKHIIIVYCLGFVLLLILTNVFNIVSICYNDLISMMTLLIGLEINSPCPDPDVFFLWLQSFLCSHSRKVTSNNVVRDWIAMVSVSFLIWYSWALKMISLSGAMTTACVLVVGHFVKVLHIDFVFIFLITSTLTGNI